MGIEFTPSGVMTITTDFGHRGPFVGTMKGVILSRVPSTQIIDLTHEVYVHWPAEAGFWLRRAYCYFPRGTVHLAVVDPGVGTARDMLLVLADGHAFIAPDNGLLGEVIENLDGAVLRLQGRAVDNLKLDNVSATFHGRDVFAPIAAALVAGDASPADLGELTEDYIPSIVEPPERRGSQWIGIVITSDNFGNLITNIESQALDGMRNPVVSVGGREIAVARTYGEVTPGNFLALVNSFGVVEIACAEGSAAHELGIARGAPVSLADAG